MAVDINEYRKEKAARMEKEAAEAAKKQSETPLLEQDTAPEANLSGNPVLDKLIRALQPVIKQLDDNVLDSARVGIRAPKEEVFREIQLQHAYMSGKLDGFKEIVSIAQMVALEEKKNSVVIPS